MADNGCNCQFTDSAYLFNTCEATAGLPLFMSLVGIVIRAQCDLAQPCSRFKDVNLTDRTFDFIVVGGGVAGAVVAGRLSENPAWKVLLLEAGPEEPTTTSVPAFAFSAIGTHLDWQFKTEPQQNACRRNKGICRWPRGRMLGGTAALNGMMYTRGHRSTYDDWARAGNSGWSYDDVLPYFIKSENNKDPEITEPRYHGRQGPLTVQRFPHRPAITEDILRAADELGYRRTDLNGRNQTGFDIAQMMVDSGLRASTARMYLRANKHRKNLVVKINSQVTRIIIDPMVKKARAVEYFDAFGREQVVTATKEIVLSAGVIGSSQLLLLSGVGPHEDLDRMGISVIQDLPVGKNLQNHVGTGLKFLVDDINTSILTESTMRLFLEERNGPLTSTGMTQVTGFIKSRYVNNDVPDLQMFFDGFSASCSDTGRGDCSDRRIGVPCGKRTVYIRPTNILPKSRGYLTLKSDDPLVAPAIFPNYLTEKIDEDVLMEGIRFALSLVNTTALRKWGMELDRTPMEGCEEIDFGTDEYWRCVIREHTGPENHQGGTCKMGPRGEPGAVVDAQLRVHGIANLRVADASVFPTVPNGNIMSSVVLVGEKAADMIRETWNAQNAKEKYDQNGPYKAMESQTTTDAEEKYDQNESQKATESEATESRATILISSNKLVIFTIISMMFLNGFFGIPKH